MSLIKIHDVYYYCIDPVDLLAYPLFEVCTTPLWADLQECVDQGFIQMTSWHVTDETRVEMSPAGQKARHAYYHALPQCFCGKSKLWRQFTEDAEREAGGYYHYKCLNCSVDLPEQYAQITTEHGDHAAYGEKILIRWGTLDEIEEAELYYQKGGEKAAAAVKSAASLALADADDDTPKKPFVDLSVLDKDGEASTEEKQSAIAKVMARYGGMLCTECKKKGMVLREAPEGGWEWYCTHCGGLCYSDDEGTYGPKKMPATPQPGM